MPSPFPKDGFRRPKNKRFGARMVIATLVTTIAVIGLLPFTQMITDGMRDIVTFRQVDIAPPPPPPPPPEPPPPEEEEPEENLELQEQQQQLTLSELEAALNPGIGGAMAGAFNLDAFSLGPDAIADMKIFSIRELDSRPKALKQVYPKLPPEVGLNGYSGKVRLQVMIDTHGNVSIMKVLSADHQVVVQALKQALVKWKFEIPMKDGKPVRVKYIFPYKYDYSN